MAGFDFDRCRRVASWPLVEVLHAYQHRLRQHAFRLYLHRYLVWATLAHPRRKQQKPPEQPAILKDD